VVKWAFSLGQPKVALQRLLVQLNWYTRTGGNVSFYNDIFGTEYLWKRRLFALVNCRF
jgi:hypothetical protein